MALLSNSQKQLLRSKFPSFYNFVVNLNRSFSEYIAIRRHKQIYGKPLSSEQGNELIAKMIKEPKPLMVSRFGSIEAQCVY